MHADRAVEMLSPDGQITSTEMTLWDEDPDDPELVRLSVAFLGREITRADTDYFAALRAIRTELEQEGLLLICYGASRNVYPSSMMRSMGSGDRAYKLYMGRPARQSDIVSIFDTGSDVLPATVDEQEAYYKKWLSSLGGSRKESARLMGRVQAILDRDSGTKSVISLYHPPRRTLTVSVIGARQPERGDHGHPARDDHEQQWLHLHAHRPGPAGLRRALRLPRRPGGPGQRHDPADDLQRDLPVPARRRAAGAVVADTGPGDQALLVRGGRAPQRDGAGGQQRQR